MKIVVTWMSAKDREVFFNNNELHALGDVRRRLRNSMEQEFNELFYIHTGRKANS